jgi:adenine-specific DNA-methyltransferase
VFDPACGAGALLLPPLRSWLGACNPAQPDSALAAVTTAVDGCDLDEAAVWLGNVALASILLHVADGLEAPESLAAAC